MKRTILFIAMFLCLLSFDSASILQQESSGDLNEAFDLATNKFVSISPCALKPKWPEVYKNGSFVAGPAEAYMTNIAGTTSDLFAPVNLPDGVTIKKVGLLCIDNDDTISSEYILARLDRKDYQTNSIQTVAEVSTIGLSGSPDRRIRQTASISYPTVDNRYTYSLRVRFGVDGSTGLIFYGFWILYE